MSRAATPLMCGADIDVPDSKSKLRPAEGFPTEVKPAALTKNGRLHFVFEASGSKTRAAG
jgi:hypothetical protein